MDVKVTSDVEEAKRLNILNQLLHSLDIPRGLIVFDEGGCSLLSEVARIRLPVNVEAESAD
jgi:hypothetical protein